MNNPLLGEIKNWFDDPSRAKVDKLTEGYIALLIYLVEQGDSRQAYFREQWEKALQETRNILKEIKP